MGPSSHGKFTRLQMALGLSYRSSMFQWPKEFTARVVLVASIGVGTACEGAPAEQGPEEVVRQFVERMQSVHGNPDDARAAYELMWSGARKNLGERAKRASAASGRRVAPEEMIAPSRFSLSFSPKAYAARIDGVWAEVTVTGDQPSRETTKVRCTKEEGMWRVVLELPPVAPIQRRVETDSKQ